jgi:hypothetical protein
MLENTDIDAKVGSKTHSERLFPSFTLYHRTSLQSLPNLILRTPQILF